MATKRNLDANIQVKEINGQRWVCEKILPENKSVDDFLDNADNQFWRKIKPFHSYMTTKIENYIPGTSQSLDDKKKE